MMKYLSLFFISLVAVFCSCSQAPKSQDFDPKGRGLRTTDSLGIKLAIQSYTFHKFTVVETFEKVKELKIKYLEIYPGHKLGGKWGDKVFGFDLTSEEQEELKKLAADHDIKIVACGVFTTSVADDWNKFFDFAKSMELEYITCEPEYEHLDLVEKLAIESGIKVGIHNHPQPSNYWNTDLLLDEIKDRSPLIGACADVGHWNREGLDQIECLEKLKDRIISLHLKDIEVKRPNEDEQEDVKWGEGALDVDAIILTLKEQNFKGYIAIEYEANWLNSVNDIKACILYYDLVTHRIFN